MAKVTLSGPLQAKAGGKTEFEIEAADVRALLKALSEECPSLKPTLDKGVTVVIDGEIYREAWLEKVPPDSEVHLLPKMAGG